MNFRSSYQINSIQYRPDIDGLRAIAVVSVIVFHIDHNYLPGGFLGVDLFFVISGYLITLILAKNIATTGRLNIVDFYRRRIQRIFPALIFMLVSTLIVGYMMLTPKDYAQLLTSALWSLFSAANVYFFSYISTGYFATQTEELPLMHLWSLGVEEQFYILWPFIVFILIKSVKSTAMRLVVITTILLTSLVLAQILLPDHQSFTYYMLPTRAWELMAGGIIAFVSLTGITLTKKWAEVFASLGFMAIVLSLVMVTKNDAVPGIAAVPLVVGCAALILAGNQTYISRFLSLKPLVGIGLVSYSAYLWHWPILAFLRYGLVKIDLPIMAAVVVATFIMATFSYFCVESPLRKQAVKPKKVFVWYFSVPFLTVASVAVVFIYLIKIKMSTLYPWHQYEKAVDTRSIFAYKYTCQQKALKDFPLKFLTMEKCVFPEKTKPSVLLVGDSNAAHYLGMLHLFAKHYGFSIRNATQSSCPLLFDGDELSWVSQKYPRGCGIYRAAVEAEFTKYDTVIIGGVWIMYDEAEGNAFRLKMKQTLATLSRKAKNVIILAAVPNFEDYNKACQIRSIRLPYLNCEKLHFRQIMQAPINKYLSDLSKGYQNIYLFDVSDQLCTNFQCSPYLNGKPVYFNANHLTMVGSKEIGEKMLREHSPSLSIFEKIGQLKVAR